MQVSYTMTMVIVHLKQHSLSAFAHRFLDYKSNFERLEKLVLIGGPDDGIVEPWQSA